MTYIFLTVVIFCSQPENYTKFKSEGSFKGLEITRCENAMIDCITYSSDLGYCIGEVEDL